VINEKATLGGNREVAHETPDPNANLNRNGSPRKSTPPTPVASLSEARRRRAFRLLAGEEIPARVWNDRPRGAA
jgi:hypothetical protein